MPLTALLEDGRRITAIDFDDDTFDHLRGNPRRREKFFCQFCRSSMHPKRIAEHSTRFFAHDPGSDCPMAAELRGESPEHLAIKSRLLQAIDGTDGWSGTAEVRVDTPDRSFFVADVVATPDSTERRPWVFEAQLSRQSRSWAMERTSDRVSFGYVNWLTVEPQSWSLDVPSLVIDASAETITGGVVEVGEYQDEFVPVAPQPMVDGIRTMLRDRYRWIEHVGWIRPDENRTGVRRPRMSSISQGVPSDDCHRPRTDPELIHSERPRGRPHLSDEWTDIDWHGRARMAEARRWTGKPLDWVDVEALRRFPEPAGILGCSAGDA